MESTWAPVKSTNYLADIGKKMFGKREVDCAIGRARVGLFTGETFNFCC
jgi:hypothetical protein